MCPPPLAFRAHAPQNHQPEPPPRFLLSCGAASDPLLLLPPPSSRMANAHSAVALCGSVRFAFIQQLCSVPLSPSRYPHPAPVQLDCDAQASMQPSMLVTLTLPTSTAWSPEKSMPQYCWNCFESASAVYSVLLDPGQVMLEVSGVADAEDEDDVAVGVEVGRAVMKIVVAAGLLRC